jgi:ribose-phosphate pyrophosphokinase
VRENFFELLQAGDAFKMAGASKVTAIMPYHPFSRQDKSTGRECLTASMAARIIESSGFDNVICSDLHSAQMIGFYRGTKIDNLPSSEYLISKFKKHDHKSERLVVMAPDAGGAKRAELYAKELGARPAQAFKIRSSDKANTIEELKVAGLVEGCNLLIVDDMIDTAGSLKKVVEKLRGKNVNEVYVCCAHALLNGSAIQIIKELGVDILTTDSIPRTKEFKAENPWYKEVSLAPLFAKAIHNINNDESVSGLYHEDPKYH